MSEEYRLSDRDRYILELNHAGHSIRMISVLLKQKYKIEMSPSSVGYHLSELRQDPNNKVQLNNQWRGARRPTKENRWYKIMEHLKEAIDEYNQLHGNKPSSRTMYYQLLDEHVLTGSQADQHQFISNSVRARLGWLDSKGELMYPKLDIDRFAEDESRSVSDNFEDHRPTPPTEPGPIQDPDDYIDEAIESLKNAVGEYNGVGMPGYRGKRGGYWYGQPKYVEVWQEKNDLMPEFEKILEDQHIVIRSNRGFSSLIFLYMCVQALKEIIDAGFKPEDIYILYCGDWDPSGENIDWYLNKRLKQLGLSGIHFKRIAVTPKQIEEFKLPLMSVKQKADKEAPNPNMKDFVRRHDSKATHLNAFFTKRLFKTFTKMLRKAVDEHYDKSIYNNMVAEYDRPSKSPERYYTKDLKESHRKMFEKITEAFRPGWDEYYAADIEYPYEKEDAND